MALTSTISNRIRLVDKLTGTILDRFSDEDIKISNNILELFDISEIPGTFTQQIQLPGTKKNNAFFEHYYDISIYDPDIFNTNQVVEAYLDCDGYYIINGYIQLDRVNVNQNKYVDSYEVTMYGIITNFSVDAKSMYLNDIETLSKYNHTASLWNVSESFGGRLFGGDIRYSLAEYGQKLRYTALNDFNGIDDYAGSITLQNMKPSIRVKAVLDEIFNTLGYRYSSSFFDQDWIQDIYMPCNREYDTLVFTDKSIRDFGKGKAIGIRDQNFTINTLGWLPFGAESVEYKNNDKMAVSTGSLYYTVDKPTKLDCEINLSYFIDRLAGAGSGQPMWHLGFESGSTVYSQLVLADLNEFLQQKANNTTSTAEEYQNYNMSFQSGMLLPGTYRLVYKIVYYGIPNFNVIMNPTTQQPSTFTVTKVGQTADFEIVDIPYNMPYGTNGIKIIDFIKGLQKKWNLVIYPDKRDERGFIIETFNNWYRSGKIWNLNDYVNLKDKIEYIPAKSLAWRSIKITDAKDGDYISDTFSKAANRIYGESTFYDSGSYYSNGDYKVETVFSSAPLIQVQGSVYSGSSALGACRTYRVLNNNTAPTTLTYYECDSNLMLTMPMGGYQNFIMCSPLPPYGTNVVITDLGECQGIQSDSEYPMYIPAYVSDVNYSPAKVNPRLFFYNGNVKVKPYRIEGYFLDSGSITNIAFYDYPYFDHYSAASGSSIPSATGSMSLLFNNEQQSLGSMPIANTINTYWNKYLGLLYNPRTKLVNASAVIPFAEYVQLELNDIAQLKGNYYHIRAINDYNINTGECHIQLVGPIIADTIYYINNPDTSGGNPQPPVVNYANIHWTLTSATGVDTNFIIQKSGLGQILLDQTTDGSGSLLVPEGTSISFLAYSNTNQPPSNWGIYATASLSGSVSSSLGAILSEGYTKIYANNSLMNVNVTPDLTVVGNTDYYYNVVTNDLIQGLPTYNYYYADRYDCVDCGTVAVTDEIVAIRDIYTPLLNRYYPMDGATTPYSQVWKLKSTGAPTTIAAPILDYPNGGLLTCTALCSII